MDTTDLARICAQHAIEPDELGLMIVDHGSRRAASNAALLDVVSMFRQHSPYRHVEPAHMELAEPSIATAFETLVSSGVRMVVVHPYFLLPGRHWAEDIPALAAAAAKSHPDVRHVVTAPLGIHRLMCEIMNDRIMHCLSHVAGEAEACDVCDQRGRCHGL